jgi:hypothetical protein
MLERLWPEQSSLPREVCLICEQDTRYLGMLRANSSNVVTIHDDGTFEVEGNFMQITGLDGDYRGSYPYSPEAEYGPKFAAELARQVRSVAAWLHSIGFRGRAGMDYFVVQNDSGELSVIMTEVNGRAPISGVAQVMAQKLGAPAWMNINVELPAELRGRPATLHSMDDFRDAFGEAAEFKPGDFSAVRILPQAMRALHDEHGLAVPSRKVKALIVGPNMDTLFAYRRRLQEEGFNL